MRRRTRRARCSPVPCLPVPRTAHSSCAVRSGAMYFRALGCIVRKTRKDASQSAASVASCQVTLPLPPQFPRQRFRLRNQR